jgi:hypothetical protein
MTVIKRFAEMHYTDAEPAFGHWFISGSDHGNWPDPDINQLLLDHPHFSPDDRCSVVL